MRQVFSSSPECCPLRRSRASFLSCSFFEMKQLRQRWPPVHTHRAVLDDKEATTLRKNEQGIFRVYSALSEKQGGVNTRQQRPCRNKHRHKCVSNSTHFMPRRKKYRRHTPTVDSTCQSGVQRMYHLQDRVSALQQAQRHSRKYRAGGSTLEYVPLFSLHTAEI